MKILLVDADSTYNRQGKLLPNLALMKLSASCKTDLEVDDVGLAYFKAGQFVSNIKEPDGVFISCLFTRNVDRVHELQVIYPKASCGGSGYDIMSILSEGIEHTMPDYSLYGIDYSMGYTTRGCFRDCGFCIIPKKEGKIHHNAEVTEFLHPDHDKLMLLDNNFFSGPRWRDHVKFLVERKIKVCITQGIDARILTDEMADAIHSMDFHNRTFHRPTIYTAFDNLSDEVEFRRGVEILEAHGIPMTSIIVYMIVGFHTTLADNMARLKIIREYGMDPFVMRFAGSSTQDVHFSRWVNRFSYKTITFDRYVHRDHWMNRVRRKYRTEDLVLSRWA